MHIQKYVYLSPIIAYAIGDGNKVKQKLKYCQFPDGYGKQAEARSSHSDLCIALLKNPKLKGWERLFVSTLQQSSKPGRRQLEKLDAIAAKLNAVDPSLSAANTNTLPL